MTQYDAIWNPVGDNEPHRDPTEQQEWDIMMIGAQLGSRGDTVRDLMAPYNTKENSTAFKKT